MGVNLTNPTFELSYGSVNMQTEAKRAYIEKLKKDGNVDIGNTPSTDLPKTAITVGDIRIATVSGESVLYITANDGNLYKQSISNDESVMLIKVGDELTVYYTETEINKIRQINEWYFKGEEPVETPKEDNSNTEGEQ